VGANNPLAGQSGTCLSGLGSRHRAIGSSEEVKSVQNSSAKFGGLDGIGYGLFGYGNYSSVANSTAYGYIQLDGVDPLFASYGGSDPGQPTTAGTIRVLPICPLPALALSPAPKARFGQADSRSPTSAMALIVPGRCCAWSPTQKAKWQPTT